MKRQCPQCQSQLDEFEISCDCGWKINLPETNSQRPVTPTANATETAEQQQSAMGLAPMEIEARIQQSMEFIEREDYQSALMFLNRAIIDAPAERLAECFSLRGYVHLKSLNFDRAELDCTEAIRLNWDEAQTFAWRAAARGEQNKWRLAFDDLDRACELAEPNPDQYLRLMDSYAAAASEYFRELVKAGKDSPDMFFERGWIYLRSGKYEKAERDFQQAIINQPNHPWASVGLAELLLREDISQGVSDLCTAAMGGGLECKRKALQIHAQLNQKVGNNAWAVQDLDKLAELAKGNVQEQVECAKLRSKLGDHVKAIDELTEVMEESPGYHIAILVRGDCFNKIRNYGLAINDYSKYLSLYPKDIRVLVRRARVYLAIKRWDSAHADLQSVSEIDETDFDAFLVRSRVYLGQGQLDTALTECQRAVQVDDHNPEVFDTLAAIYSRLCDYGNAIEQYSRSIEIADTPEQKSQYLYHRGIAYYELEDFEKALKDFKTASKANPNHAGNWIWKAAVCARMEKWSDAILGLQEAILVRPSASEQYQKLGQPVAEKAIAFFNRQQQRGTKGKDIYRQRGLAYQFLNRDEEAIRDYTSSLKENSDDPQTLIRRGQVYTRSGNFDAATKDFTLIIRNDKDNHLARYCRAIARLAQGKYEEAKKDLKKAIRTAPEHPRYHILLGELLQKVGSDAGVLEAFDKAILQDPSDPVTYRRRGAAHQSFGNHLNAISDFTRSLELYPPQLDLLVQRGQTYLKTNQPIMAIEDFELALTHNDRLAKAYSGRATALVTQGRHEYTLIWLTKAIHRFTESRELSEIIFARGKVFYQMGRYMPAIADFSTVIELMRGDNRTVAGARYARAIAEIHCQEFQASERDFKKLRAKDENNGHFKSALKWLSDQSQSMPKFLKGPDHVTRPTRPAIVRNGIRLNPATITKWETTPPHDSWVVRTADKKEYGPVQLPILNSWVNEGRIDVGMKLLRADWSKWKRAEKIMPEITPLESAPGMIEEFPELEIGKLASRNINNE